MKSASFRAVQPVWGKRSYIYYDYVHLDNKRLSKPQRTVMQNANPVKDTYGLTSWLLSALRKSLCVYDTVKNSILNRTFKIRNV